MLFNRKLKCELELCRQQYQTLQAQLQAMHAQLAVLELTPQGKITTGNAAWLALLGFSQSELEGQPHRMVCAPQWLKSLEYSALWAGLKQGKAQSGTYQSLNRQGETVWPATDFLPVLDAQGRVLKVLCVAKNVTVTQD